MVNFLWRLIATALATAAAVWLVPGITLGPTTLTEQILTLLGVALVFGAVNAVVKPLAQAVGTCLIIITMGLFLLVINALLLMLTSWLAGVLGLGFHVDGFWSAFWGAILISLVGALFGGVLGNDRD